MKQHNSKLAAAGTNQVNKYYDESLPLLTGSISKFDDDIWIFESSVNFHARFDIVESSEALQQANSDLKIDCVLIAKCMFLDAVADKTSMSVYRATYNQIIKLFAFLKQKNIVAIDARNLADFLEFSLITYVHAEKIMTKSAILSSSQLLIGLQLNSWFNSLQALNVESELILTESFSRSQIDSALKSAINDITRGQLAYGDWLNGGNLNSLTLDYGRYFVEHNALLYQRYARYAQAIRLCQKNYRKILDDAACKGTVSNYQSSINQFLANAEVADVPDSLRAKMSDQLFERIRSSTRNMLTSMLAKLESIDQIQEEIADRGLLEQFMNSSDKQSDLDFFTRLAELYAYVQFRDIHQPILKSVEQEIVLYEGSRTNVDFKACKEIVLTKLNALVENHKAVIFDNQHFEKMGLELSDSKGATYLAAFMRTIEAAGVTLFVASVGWRESEFGFSIRDVKLEVNHDVRDQLAFPARYFTHSLVPKTLAGARELRELNLNAFRVLQQQTLLTQNLLDEPALYSFQRLQTKDASKSSDMIQRGVKKNWHNFVWNYPQFVEIDHFCREHVEFVPSLQDIESNNEAWLSTRLQLLKIFDSSLVNAYELARSEYRRVNFYICSDKRKNYVRQFAEGSCSNETIEIMKEFLSDSTLERLTRLRVEDVGPLLTEEITAEILGSCKYPTAHAFRHMWAEAVLRRFSGDLGSFIRSSFKHVSKDMWQAYICDKANIHTLKSAKREVISSLLNSYIAKEGEGFAGGMSKYIDRMLNGTAVKKANQLNEVMEIINEEIIDIQASTWGFCLLKKHARQTAKCAENGEPRRYVSEPSVCMHCSNFLATEQSISSIALLAENSLTVAAEEDIPKPFRIAATKHLKKAYQQLEKLGADPRLLIKIKEVTA
ncbi:hypothetical protein SAMN04488070_1575 [Pseudidiomarina maritima]|uniref:Uncharacterized protein n=1 Tax=Pseudidiomarina maritima TaxID=519453 RepID=A0A1I6H856_9GAMM|nr:hypothetical protein [Pseudidiomarina maritima]SFR50497.1 hypothetical protein SAMN04488070_1575 [Pseudidiomarina maritima]